MDVDQLSVKYFRLKKTKADMVLLEICFFNVPHFTHFRLPLLITRTGFESMICVYSEIHIYSFVSVAYVYIVIYTVKPLRNADEKKKNTHTVLSLYFDEGFHIREN